MTQLLVAERKKKLFTREKKTLLCRFYTTAAAFAAADWLLN